MKLVEIYIDNFGKFSSARYTFNGGLNDFCEENGYGKTTIAAFIKAMFYGMPAYTTRTKDFTDRQHYLPFNGGKYGGSLTFTMGGAEYRIERVFDEKSDTRDFVRVLRNNAPYTGFGRDIGMKVFGIDRDSFERTVFIDSRAVDLGASDSISAKLGGIAGGTDGDETITAAALALEKRAKYYKPERGQGGKINELNRKIDDLSRNIHETEIIVAALAEKYAECNALQRETAELEEERKRRGKAETIAEQWKTYDNFTEQEQAAQLKYNQIVGAYPRGIPSEEEIKQLKNYNLQIDRDKNTMDARALGGVQKQKLEELRRLFAGGVPEESRLGEADGDATRCIMLERDIGELKNTPEDARLKGLEYKFEHSGHGVPDSGTIQQYEEKIKALHEVDLQIAARMRAGQAQAAAQIQRGKKGGKWHILAAVFAILLVAGGIALMLFNVVAGAVLTGAGVVLLIVALVLYFNGKRVTAGAPAVNIDDTLAELQLKKDKYINELRAFLTPYGYYGDSVESDFTGFKNDIKLYTELKERARQTTKDIADKTAELDRLKAELSKLLAAYGITNADLQAGLRQLRALVDEYNRLCEEERQSAEDVQTTDGRINESYKGVQAILAKYGIALDGDLAVLAERLDEAAREAARYRAEAEKWHRQAEDYRRQKGLTERPVLTESGANMDELSRQLAEKNSGLAALTHEISIMEERAEKLDGLKDALAETTEELSAAEERYKLLVAAKKLLEEAHQNLKDRYVSPVKDRFTYYAGKIKEALGENVRMDGNYNVSFERGGVVTSDKYLSAGQRCVCALCFRLALTDNMYSGEQPFIIMDDPFVNIDERHLQDAVLLVRALAKDRQIIYFSCHSSRKTA